MTVAIKQSISRKYEHVHILVKENGQPIGAKVLQKVNGITLVPVNKISEYILTANVDKVRKLIKAGKLMSYDMHGQPFTPQFSGTNKKFINYDDWFQIKERG